MAKTKRPRVKYKVGNIVVKAKYDPESELWLGVCLDPRDDTPGPTFKAHGSDRDWVLAHLRVEANILAGGEG